MSIRTWVLRLVVAGIGLWLLHIAPFIDDTIKRIVFWLVLVALFILALGELGLLPNIGNLRW